MIELRTRAPDLEKAVRSEALNGRQTLCAMRALFCLAVYDASARPLDTLLEQLDPKLEFEPVERAELEYLVLEYSLGHRPIPPPERLNSALVSAQEAGHTNLEASLRICAGYLALGAADTALATVHAEVKHLSRAAPRLLRIGEPLRAHCDDGGRVRAQRRAQPQCDF